MTPGSQGEHATLVIHFHTGSSQMHTVLGGGHSGSGGSLVGTKGTRLRPSLLLAESEATNVEAAPLPPAFPPPPSPPPPPPLPSPSGRAVSAGSDWSRCPAEEIGERDHPGSDFPGWAVGVGKVEPAGQAALHVSRGQRAATLYCAHWDRSHSAGPGSAAAAGAAPAALAEPGTQVKIPGAGKVPAGAVPSPCQTAGGGAVTPGRTARLPAGFWSGCLPGLRGVLRAAAARSAPLF